MATIDAFYVQFATLIGFEPFRWQRRLFNEHFLIGDLPAAVDLPTGLGKTSVMAIWYLAFKAGAPVPRRLVYVVDRRAVVDQATTIADEIKAKSGDGTLHVSTLRGQHVDNRAWLENPAEPAIIVGTVDMIGSRLLFSGYGVSRKMRPYHAGLLGADTLVVLDESHLVPPFERLLEAIEGGAETFGQHDETHRKMVPRFKLLSLSATGRTRKGKVFRLDQADLTDAIVEKRLAAKKRLVTVEANGRKLEEVLADEAWALSGEGKKAIRCLIYSNSRETAEKVKAAIEKLAKGAKIPIEPPELLVGARRVKERADAAERLTALGFLAGSDVPRDKPAFLVATSAGEVGVDLDADHMVCDLAPWERMVQRLGRVNRRGDGDARIVLVHEGKPEPKKPDEPKPDELRAMVSWRTRVLLDALPTNECGVDVSPGALRAFKLRAEQNPELADHIKAASTPEPLYPALTRPLVDDWSMTSLPKHPGRPKVQPWLRGWVDEEPQTTVVWRRHLPIRTEGSEATSAEIEAFFEAAPPHASEKLETGTSRVVAWLMDRASATLKVGRLKTEQDDKAEAEESGEPDSEGEGLSSKQLGADDIAAFALSPAGDRLKDYRLRGLVEDKTAKSQKDTLRRALAGATLVVDARLKGLTSGLLDKAGGTEVRTADDGGPWLSSADGSPIVPFRVHPPAAPEAIVGRGSYVFATRRSNEGEDLEVLNIETWTTEESRSASVHPQLLAEHQSWTEKHALVIAETVGLTCDHKRMLAIAARLHDEGKKAPRWQRAFNAPREKDERGSWKVFAKTKGPIRPSVLDHYRHEFGSLPFVMEDAAFKALPPDLQDLALHLVAAHHGNARPLIETKGCEDAPPSALHGRARDIALRFARLQKRWGPWGLAWWEALLRAADQQASRENDKRGESNG